MTDVHAALDLLCPDAPVALGALHPRAPTDWMEFRYFEKHDEAAAWAMQLGDVKAVYVVMNPYLKTSKGAGIAKKDITRRRWLLIDCDAKRQKGTNATDDELGMARDVALKIKAYLTSLGWPDPVVCVSGNGCHLLYAIDLPNDAASTVLIDGILKHLARFDTPGVSVDQTTGDASQVTKLYGTWARKGPATDDRPHRLSAITSIPARLDVVPLSALQKACAEKKPKGALHLYDLDSILAKLTRYGEPAQKGEYTEYQIQCPWHEEHSDQSEHGTIFTWSDEGAPGFKCPHDSCTRAGRKWEALRDYYGITPTRDQGILDEFRDYFIAQLGAHDGLLKTMVGCDREFPPSFQTFSAFSQYYCDTLIQVGKDDKKKTTTRAKLWLTDRQHRKYSDVQFLPPPCVVPPGILNLWNGFAVSPDPDPYPERRCALFLDHIRTVVCGGENPDVAEFHLDVLAAKVQRPAVLTEVAIVYRGIQGVGKNAFTEYLESVYGRHLATIAKHQLATGRFNSVLSSKLVIVLDEAMWPGNREFIGALKSLVTDPKLAVERKGIDVVFETNFVQVIVFTNGQWAWPTELSDRRALILDVLPTRKDDIKYFAALHHERKNGGAEALLAYLQQRPITHELRVVPRTKARMQQVEITDDDPVRSLWFDSLYRGTTFPESEGWDEFISTKDLHEYYVSRCRAGRQRPLSQRLFLQEWRALLPPACKANEQQRLVDRDLLLEWRKRLGYPRDKDGVEHPAVPVMRRGTRVPFLTECRKQYAGLVEGHELDWPEPPEEEM